LPKGAKAKWGVWGSQRDPRGGRGGETQGTGGKANGCIDLARKGFIFSKEREGRNPLNLRRLRGWGEVANKGR